MNLVNKKYPVKDIEGNFVGYQTITAAIELQNLAGYCICLDNADTGIFIGYKEASSLKDNVTN